MQKQYVCKQHQSKITQETENDEHTEKTNTKDAHQNTREKIYKLGPDIKFPVRIQSCIEIRYSISALHHKHLVVDKAEKGMPPVKAGCKFLRKPQALRD